MLCGKINPNRFLCRNNIGEVVSLVRAIINADDFGISEDVNDAIRLSFEKGIITNTTLMVNMPYAADAAAMAEREGFLDKVGLHLNLTAGVPLTGTIKSMRTFCDGKGEFHAGFHRSTKSRLILSPAESKAVAEEIEAQIRRYLSFGLPEKHLDSHHHVHTDLSVWKAAEPIFKKYGFKSVRLGRNMFDVKPGAFNRLYKDYYNGRLKKLGVTTTEFFGSFQDFAGYYSQLPDGALAEIMVHPMFSEEGELMDTNLEMERVSEFIKTEKVYLQSY